MRILPVILGAAACALSAGAFAGATIQAEPLQRGDILVDAIAAKAAKGPAGLASARSAEADQFAMETPDGRVELEDLALYGRLRGEYAARQMGSETEQPAPVPTDEAAPDQVIAMVNPMAPGIAVEFDPPQPVPQPRDTTIPAADGGSARLIDVSAALAERR